MYYITLKQNPRFKQMTIEELLFGEDKFFSDKTEYNSFDESSTRTLAVERVSDRFKSNIDVDDIIKLFVNFNKQTEQLRAEDRMSLYNTFYIPKRTSGKRRIDAPKIELMDALRELKRIIESVSTATYHTSSFAYIKGRNTLSAVKKHQNNNSKWFGKYDLSNFFGSITIEFAMSMFEKVFPFSEILRTSFGKSQFQTAIELAFLNGGLPQGTPVSPLITNIIMIPIDFELSKSFRSLNGQQYVYTRYADDFIVSSRYDFNCREIEEHICNVLNSFNSPFELNKKKTRYGSSSGSNWNLGVMLNSQNKITIGYKNKKRFEALLHNYAMDKKNGVNWEFEEVLHLNGLISYYKMVEGDTIDNIINHISRKTGVNILFELKMDLKR